MREQTEENKAIKRFTYTGPSSKNHREDSETASASGYDISRPYVTKKSGKSVFDFKETWNSKSSPSSAFFDMALPTSPRMSTTGYYSRYSSYKGGKKDSDLPRNKSPSSSHELSSSTGVSWNQSSRTGYSYSQHDSPTTSATIGSKASSRAYTQGAVGKASMQDMGRTAGSYSGQAKNIKESASSSWNNL
ncbi:uncharacterized protein LOC117118619 [Anneissia japonica]|uniref:uncharacterized protein LOC117118619 n=1 Tax=Anneissia japonica TaxID=1529436 RepID=UPI0014255CCB|nr:uncharacterized protein LOC117118619 [Anneissia japonica]